MDLEMYTRFVLALIAVLALIGGIAWLARRLGLGGRLAPNKSKSPRLSLVEVLALDSRRRLVLVRRDSQEHLLLLGPSGDLRVESDIEAPAPAAESPAPVALKRTESGA